MTRRTLRTITTAGVLVALTAIGAPTAAAGEDPVERTAGLIADVAPDQGEIVAGIATKDEITAQVGDKQVTVPADPDRPIVLDAAAGAPALSVNLPAEVDVREARVAGDGTVVYEAAGDGASAAVQALDDGSARIQTVIPDADGPHEFTYTFGSGITPVRADDGTVALTRDSGVGQVVLGSVGDAWASDADGSPVTTAYRIDGDALVQTVDADAGTRYPVVADPSISFGWGVYAKFSKSEVKTIVNSGGLNVYNFAAIVCGKLPWPYNAGCATLVGSQVTSVVNTFKNAKKAGRCVELRYIPGPPMQPYILVGWKGYKC